MFSDSDSDTESVHRLTINEHYAKAYEAKKEREELAKLKEKYGSDVDEDYDEDDSEDAESEDEDGEELTPAVDAAILRTLARIKKKDPSIYQQEKAVFEEEREKLGDHTISKRVPKDKSKPVTIRQHALASVLNPASRSPSPEPMTYAQEQNELRKEAVEAFHTAVPDQANGEDDDFLILREKTQDEAEKEEEEYREFLQREVGEDLDGLITVDTGEPSYSGNIVQEDEGGSEEAETKSKKKKSKGSEKKISKKSKEGKDQEFLMNYILNRGWIDRSQKRLPTYNEITSSGKGKGRAVDDSDANEEGNAEDGQDSVQSMDEDEFDDVVDKFESSYNFRFEEPGAATISRYPRNIASLVRREDTTRKEAREKRKARKEEELLKKKEEVKRLKALKMKEVRVKLERVSKEGGKSLEESEALQVLDLDGDWDPDMHDKQMADIYAQDEDYPAEEEKPQWDDDIDITDIMPDQVEETDKKKKKKKKTAETGDGESGVDIEDMDAEVQRGEDEEEWDGTEEMRKRKLDEYMDELYGMEFNDMAAGLPTRFKYAKVPQQSYALTPVEILLATDSELNQYMSIKKYAPYRKDGSNWDKNRAGRLHELKTKLKERGGQVNGESESAREKASKKRKGKKERMREKASVKEMAEGDEEGSALPQLVVQEPSNVEKMETKRRLDDERAEGTQSEIPTKKRRRRHKKVATGADDS